MASNVQCRRRPAPTTDPRRPHRAILHGQLGIFNKKKLHDVGAHTSGSKYQKQGFNKKCWRWMSPPARRTPPLPNIGSPARQGGATEHSEGVEAYTLLGEVFFLHCVCPQVVNFFYGITALQLYAFIFVYTRTTSNKFIVSGI